MASRVGLTSAEMLAASCSSGVTPLTRSGWAGNPLCKRWVACRGSKQITVRSWGARSAWPGTLAFYGTLSSASDASCRRPGLKTGVPILPVAATSHTREQQSQPDTLEHTPPSECLGPVQALCEPFYLPTPTHKFVRFYGLYGIRPARDWVGSFIHRVIMPSTTHRRTQQVAQVLVFGQLHCPRSPHTLLKLNSLPCPSHLLYEVRSAKCKVRTNISACVSRSFVALLTVLGLPASYGTGDHPVHGHLRTQYVTRITIV